MVGEYHRVHTQPSLKLVRTLNEVQWSCVPNVPKFVGSCIWWIESCLCVWTPRHTHWKCQNEFFRRYLGRLLHSAESVLHQSCTRHRHLSKQETSEFVLTSIKISNYKKLNFPQCVFYESLMTQCSKVYFFEWQKFCVFFWWIIIHNNNNYNNNYFFCSRSTSVWIYNFFF